MPYDLSNHPSRLCRTLMLAGIALFSLGSARAMLPPSPGTESLNLVGTGELRWFGLSIYEASLWTPEGQFDAVNRHQQVALIIDYARNIPSDKLVHSARTEWQRLGIRDPRTEQWCEQVALIWPDVSPGDQITTIVEKGGPTRFFFNQREIGTITDPDFGPALLDIWLHPDSRSEKLRRALIGARS